MNLWICLFTSFSVLLAWWFEYILCHYLILVELVPENYFWTLLAFRTPSWRACWGTCSSPPSRPRPWSRLKLALGAVYSDEAFIMFIKSSTLARSMTGSVSMFTYTGLCTKGSVCCTARPFSFMLTWTVSQMFVTTWILLVHEFVASVILSSTRMWWPSSGPSRPGSSGCWGSCSWHWSSRSSCCAAHLGHSL